MTSRRGSSPTGQSDAWNGTGEGGTFSCDDAARHDFGAYQGVGLMWWEIQLKGMAGLVGPLKTILDDTGRWQTEYSNF